MSEESTNAADVRVGEPVVRIEGLRKSFGDNVVLRGIDLEVQRGEVVVILGPSGSGKSTLLRCVNLLETPTDGRIFFEDTEITAKKTDINKVRAKVGMVFQNFNLFPHLTAKKNVMLAQQKVLHRGKEEAEKIAVEQLTRVGLADRVDYKPSELSGGQQQRVALARMLAARPGILMLDEPFSALDAHLKSVLEQNLVSLFDAFHGTVLYVSHDIDEALRFCDRIAVVEAGRITETGTGDDLVNRPQSLAGVKLSGCKNATAAVRVDERSVRLPKWGIEAATSAAVPEDVKALGVRAFFLQRVDGPGENCYRVRVDRVSDSRFERTVLLGFLDRDESEAPTVSRTDDEMKYLHQHLFWRVDKLAVPVDELPHEGEELWIRIPPDKVYLVSR